MKRHFTYFIIAAVVTVTATVAGAGEHDTDGDPFERANRAVLNFNFKVDRAVFKPAAKGYAKLPSPVRRGVGNFFANLWVPNTILNDLLQGKLRLAARDAGRFVVNTTVGVAGIFDPATHFGLPRRREDFGQTLAVWGVPPGPYLVVPLLGPGNLRDSAGTIPEYLGADPVQLMQAPERWYASGLRLVDARERLLGADEVLELQPDKYLFLREGYRQRRAHLINDGGDDDDDALLDELLDE